MEPVWNNLIAILTRKGLSQADLARTLGCDDQRVTNWKRRGVPKSAYTEIADALGITVEELRNTHSERRAQRSSTNSDISLPTGTGLVPVITWSRLRERELVKSDTVSYRVPSMYASDRSFVTTAETDAMSGSIPRGSMILVDPEAAADHGKVVLVDKGGKAILLRRLRQDGDRLLLVADNSAMMIPVEHFDSTSDMIIGVVRYFMGEP